ncbi:hypothetical protein GCM10022200_21070 [Microbacterium awajiense]|uniref:Lipoprotein n=1 Tax=Microbacterium awajiense TaxID=415214 RepID=A0ABP7API0_9MICO
MRRWAILTVAAAVLGLSSGCTSTGGVADGCDSSLDSTVGSTLDAFAACLSDDTDLMIRDVSVLIGEDPSYTDVAELRAEWVVVAACTVDADWRDSATVEVAVVPKPHTPSDADFDGTVACER